MKLTDFGLARSVLKQEHTAPGVVFGRAAYLSPEQARGEMADARTDVYTLGIVLWELLTGQQFLQLSGLDPAAALALVRHPKLVPPSARAPWITPVLDQVALKALAPDRDKRFQSAEELRQALTTVIAEIAPTADSSRVSDFLHSIYADTIAEERGERERFLKDEIPNFRSALARGVRFDEPRAADSEPAPASGASPGANDPAASEPNERPRRATTPRLPGMPEPAEVSERGKDAGPPAPAFLTAFRADSLRPPAGTNGQHRPGLAPSADRPAGEPLEAGPLGGRYRTGRLLVDGAVESLHTGADTEGGGRALHIYRPGPQAAALDAWKKAVRVAGRVRHPHVAELLDAIITEDGRAVAVHEPVVGVDVSALLAREQRLEPGAAVRIARELVEALGAAQAAGVAHGSLRPTSVFIDGPSHSVKLLGFGLLRLYPVAGDDRDDAGARLPAGVLEYLAPEVLRGAPADFRGGSVRHRGPAVRAGDRGAALCRLARDPGSQEAERAPVAPAVSPRSVAGDRAADPAAAGSRSRAPAGQHR